VIESRAKVTPMTLLARICAIVSLSLVVSHPLAGATKYEVATLKGIKALNVLVEDLPDGAKTLGLTREMIQTDVELKVRLAGIRAVPGEERPGLPGSPALYINIIVSDNSQAAHIEVSLEQSVSLERNGQAVVAATTWSTGILVTNPTAQGLRNYTKDHVDQFVNDWLSVNPK
jgi:hypothetical protein